MGWLQDLRHAALTAGAAEFWIACTAALLVAAAALYGAFVFLRRKRVIEDLPTALIRSAPQGYIELQGRAAFMDGDEIFAALSGRPCVWHKFKVEKRENRTRDGRRESRWVTVEQGTSDDLFYLVDHTGQCAVDPDGAAVTPTHLNVWYGVTRNPGHFHESDGVWWARTLGAMGKPYRYTERRIEPGDELFALGNFTTHGGGAAQFDRSGAVGDLLRNWKRDQAYMLQQFDANRDGEIDMEEWEAARAEAEKIVDHRHAEDGAPPPVDVLAQTRDRRQPFVIHAGSEEQIVTRCRRYAISLLLPGVPLLVLGLWALAVRLTAA